MDSVLDRLKQQIGRIDEFAAHAIGDDFDEATKLESDRILWGMFELFSNGKGMDEKIDPARFAAGMYAAIAMACSLKETLDIMATRASGRMN